MTDRREREAEQRDREEQKELLRQLLSEIDVRGDSLEYTGFGSKIKISGRELSMVLLFCAISAGGAFINYRATTTHEDANIGRAKALTDGIKEVATQVDELKSVIRNQGEATNFILTRTEAERRALGLQEPQAMRDQRLGSRR